MEMDGDKDSVKYRRIIEDIVEYYDQFFAEGIDGSNQKSIIKKVASAFDPGGVVEMAFA